MQRRMVRGLGASLVVALLVAGCGHSTILPTRAALGRPHAASATAFDASRLPASAELARATLGLSDLDRKGGPTLAQTGLTADQFGVLDRDGDGRLTSNDYFARAPFAVVRQNLKPFLPLVKQIFDQLDENHDGKVTIAEASGPATDPKGNPRAAAGLAGTPWLLHFVAADDNADQALDFNEFQTFYASLGASQAVPKDDDVIQLGGGWMDVYLRVMGTLAAWRATHPPRDHISSTPADLGLQFENIDFHAQDGIDLKGWYVPAATPTTRTVVLVHGFQSCRSLWTGQKVLPMLNDRYNAVCFDLRNHGESGGSVTSYGYWESQDVLAAVAYAKSRGATAIGVIGQSLGAATSIRAVSQDPEVKALVSDCAYATTLNAFQGAISSVWVPQPALIGAAALMIADGQLGIQMEDAQPLNMLPGLAPRPVMFIHGEDDPYIFWNNTQILYAAYQGPKDFWLCPKALHGDSDTTDPATWKTKVRTLLDAAM